jgi:fatty acid desaturase
MHKSLHTRHHGYNNILHPRKSDIRLHPPRGRLIAAHAEIMIWDI